jgi:hypothetical protein
VVFVEHAGASARLNAYSEPGGGGRQSPVFGRLCGVKAKVEVPEVEVLLQPERPDASPVRRSDEVRAELVAILDSDQTRLGQVYSLQQRRLDAAAIAAQLGVATSHFAWTNRTARALLDGNLPSPSVAPAAARRFRSILTLPALSAAARSYLEATCGSWNGEPRWRQ